MARLKEATVHEVVSWNGNQYHWNITFLRSPNDWEEEDVLRLLALLANMKVSYEGDDEILWPHDSGGQFSVKSYWREMYKRLRQPLIF